MEQLISYGSIDEMPMYNCSGRTIEEWAEKQSRPNITLGIVDLVYGIIIEILYIPCIAVMMKKEYFKHSCFKIMVFLSFVDMGCIGFFFCQSPTFLYSCGAIGLGVWTCECMTALMLAVNRFLDVVWKNQFDLLFGGPFLKLFLLIPVFYGLYFTFFTTPAIFNSVHQLWFFDPLVFEDRSNEYANMSQVVNNILVVVATCTLYLVFCVSIDGRLKGQSSQRAQFQKQIFLQTFLICAANLFASFNYVFLQFLPVPLWFSMLAHASWQFGSGFPVFVYLMINKAIRGEIFNFFKGKLNSSRYQIMEQLMFFGSIENMPLYNCSGHTLEEWSEMQSRRNFKLGIVAVVYGFLIEILYIPCLAVMMKKEYYKHSCFKIMVFLGLIDMGCIDMNFEQYANMSQVVNNILVVVATCTLYLVFCVSIDGRLKGQSSQRAQFQKQIFLQTSLICAANLFASLNYVLLQFVSVPLWFGLAAHASWQCGSGFPVFVYLTINKTIRGEIFNCFKNQKAFQSISVMEELIAYGSIENMPLYNCSGYTLEEWAEKQSRPNVSLGIFNFIYGTIIEVLYIPCLVVMMGKEHLKLSCYKIMVFLGFVDMVAVGGDVGTVQEPN
ncbi:unnamed protein product [Caenorhabditis auriculariae]|uniref:Serpentine receptor class gamma n=1 Tax=Caenorhabditis auriculariae TaxID=2777116 RepID=A0A8S1HS74_9PELO|nr:unnamed protein product [Caenorhabditis auriculariae]